MRVVQASMIVFENDDSPLLEEFFENFNAPDSGLGAIAVGEVKTDQTFPDSKAYDDGSNDEFDASLEEVFHLITHIGYAQAYPNELAETNKSDLGKAMVAAKKAGHYDPLVNDPDMEFGTQNTEYIYWAMSSLLGAQDYEGRLENISNEWSLNTADKLEDQDAAIYEILTNPEFSFPTQLPDGEY